MTVYDLTHTIHKDILVYPGTTGPELEVPFTVGEHGFQETALSLWSHVGTHMDAPGHMISGATYLDQMPVSKFMGEALKIKLTSDLSLKDLQCFEADLRKVDFVLFETGYDKKIDSEDYFKGFPVLRSELTTYLMTFNLKGVGVDAISVDAVESTDMLNHMILFESECVIVENLKGLDRLPQRFKFHAMPLNFINSDGAPVRAFAEVTDEA